jgi:hypothetical protein
MFDEKTLPHPVPVLEPLDREFGWAYVQVPLDFRTDAASWAPKSVSASVDGPVMVWAEVTATPTVLRFDPGDGSAVVDCPGHAAVAPYVPDAPGCSYTYHHASSTVAGLRFGADLSIEWTVTWRSSSGSGSFGTVTTHTAVPVGVAEIKALTECVGPEGGC